MTKTLSLLKSSGRQGALHLWRFIWLCSAATVFIALILPSRMVFSPTAVEIDGYTVRVHRTFPMDALGAPRPIIQYVETVTAYDGRVCQDSDRLLYDDRTEFGEWSIEAWAAPCMTGSFVWHADWTVYLFGFLPMRPVSLESVTFEGPRK